AWNPNETTSQAIPSSHSGRWARSTSSRQDSASSRGASRAALCCSTEPTANMQPAATAAMTATTTGQLLVRKRAVPTLPTWLGALMVSAGLGLLLGIGSPTVGRSDMPWLQWVLVGLTAWGLALLMVAVALRSPWPSTRAALIGAAAGTLFGLQDALTRYCLHWISRDFGHLVLSWQPYVVILTAVYGLTLMQSAYEAGSLSASLPPMTIGEPVIGMLIGIVAL